MFPFPMPITTLLLDGLAFEEGCQFTAAACDRRLAKARNQRHANDAAPTVSLHGDETYTKILSRVENGASRMWSTNNTGINAQPLPF